LGTPRTIAIGDIHGCLAALDALLDAIAPQAEDTIVTVGDYVDRGPDSRRVLDRLLALAQRCRLVPLLGNHDQMMLLVCDGRLELVGDWLLFGGDATVASYGGRVPLNGPLKPLVPLAHLEFLRACRMFYASDRHLFVHANYAADVPLEKQEPDTLLWESLKRRLPGPHYSGKVAIVGHTAQKSGEVLDVGYLKCIDTCCYGSGFLTALDVETGQLWQADKKGKLRKSSVA
jgi:serine/threonine protein phosphatase 1